MEMSSESCLKMSTHILSSLELVTSLHNLLTDVSLMQAVLTIFIFTDPGVPGQQTPLSQ